MYSTVNTAFTNYLDMFPNLTDSLQFLLIGNRTAYKQTLPINLYICKFDTTLLNAPINLKDFVNSYVKQKEISDLQERHETTILNTNKNFFSDNYILDIFVFISANILLMTTTLTVYLLCKHKKIRVLLASLVLYQAKEMACILQPECNFLHGFFRCHLPVEAVDVRVRISSMQGTHTFRRENTCQIIKCNS